MNDVPEPQAVTDNRRAFALYVVTRLREAGFDGLWAGGCVRDILLQQAPTDYDVATSARPEQVRELFGHRRTLAVGAAFGVIIVLGPNASAGQVEVATFRNDGGYSDGRRPDSVVFSSAVEDARRRDFTINGMFYDPVDQRVIDYVGGQDDLARGLIRAIGDADARIAEDKLRMLRAVRFAARFGFAIEAATQAALTRHASELRVVSGERLAGEMHKTLVAGGREAAVRRWAETGLLRVLLPLVADRWTQVGEEACSLIRLVRPEPWTAALASIVWPLVAEQNDCRAFQPLVADLKDRLKLSNAEAAQLKFALGEQTLLETSPERLWSEVQPRLVHPWIDVGLALIEARTRHGAVDPAVHAWLIKMLERPREELDPPPLLTGGDLQRLGFHPGPRFKELLDQLRIAQLDRAIASREQAIVWLEQQ